MKKIGLILSLLLLASFAFANAFDVAYSRTSNGYELEFELGEFRVTDKAFNGGTFATIEYEGSIVSTKEGYAELPFLNSSLQIENRNLDVQVIPGAYQEFVLNNQLLPSRGAITRDQDPATIPYVVSEDSILDEFYPGKLVKTSEPYLIRNARGINVFANPFQYNSSTKTLRVYASIRVVLSENMENPTNPLPNNESEIYAAMDNMYSSLFINYDRTRFANELDEMGSILIVRTARDADAMIPYIQWKREKGFTVYEVEVATGTNVVSTIQEQYDLNNDILYVQLVGDWADIKTDLGGGANAPMDPIAGCVVGTDTYPDVIVGRFSASTPEHVTIQTNKAITYERNPDTGGSWYSKLLGVASNEGASNGDDSEADYVHMNVIKDDKLLPFTYTDNVDVYDPSANSSMVANAVNDGIGIANYIGHGSHASWVTSGFSTSHVNQLNNGDMLPVILSVACVNGEFHNGSDCFAEAWLRKENGGAAAFWGATINQPWQPPMRGQDYANDMLIGGYDYSSHAGQNGSSTDVQKTTFGSACFNAAVLMYSESSQSSDLETLQTWTIFGDASLQVRTATPSAISLSNETVLMGVDFTTNVTAGGIPAAGAIVTLSQGSETFSGVTDASGNISITNDLEAGTCTMVVTGFNLNTIYNDAITVAPSAEAYLMLQEATYGDDNNNDVDYNESGNFGVSVKNVGSETATSVALTLSSTSSYITVTDTDASAGDIAADEMITIADAFGVTFANNVPDQEMIEFDLVMVGQENWDGTFSVLANAPAFNLGNMIINDAAGNNDGMLDAGETATITIPITNTGHAGSEDITAELTSANPEILIVNTASVDIAAISIGGTSAATFEVNVAEDATMGSFAVLDFNIYSGAYTVNESLISLIGLICEDFETSDYSKFDWVIGDPGWEIDSEAYEGNSSSRSMDTSHNEEAVISLTLDIASDSEISFYKKVSSENNYDYLKFYINETETGSWSGNIAWSQETYDVTAGSVTFTWKFEKDSSVDGGDDCAWIDYIVFPGGDGNASGNPIATVSTTELTFGDVIVNQTAMQEITISNLGAGELNGTITTPAYWTSSQDTYSISSVGSVTLEITFAPTTIEGYEGNLVISTNDPNNTIILLAITGNGIASVDGENPDIPAVTSLQGNYPNPFNPTTNIKFGLKEESNVKLEIFNIRGQKIQTLVNDQLSAGFHTIPWEGNDSNSNISASGIYFYRLTAEKYTSTKKMILMK